VAEREGSGQSPSRSFSGEVTAVKTDIKERDHIYEKVQSIIREDGRSTYIGEDDLVSLVKGGIRIDFHIKNSNLNIENVFRTVKRTQKIVQDRLGHNLEKIGVEIFNSGEELIEGSKSKSVIASWMAGIFDGNIRVVAEKDADVQESLYILLTHEIVHLAVAEMSAGACPYWLDEGLAVQLSQHLPNLYQETVAEAVHEDRMLPLETLERPVAASLDEWARRLFYAQSASITGYFIESYGWQKLQQVLRSCRDRPFHNVLGTFATNYYLLEQGWKRWVRMGGVA
jgi:hypothetical protein